MTFSHLDERGQPNMVDVSEKQVSLRTATARSIVILPAEVLEKFINGDIQTKKGSVFQTAIIAGIMAAKKTGELIPLWVEKWMVHFLFAARRRAGAGRDRTGESGLRKNRL